MSLLIPAAVRMWRSDNSRIK